MARFPKTLYVKMEQADGETFPVATESVDGMAEVGETVPFAVYQLMETGEATGTVNVRPTKRRRSR